MVARFDAGNARAHAVHDPDALMPQNAARRTGWDVAFENMQVGSANRCFGDSDDCIARRLQDRFGTLLQGLETGTAINQCLHDLNLQFRYFYPPAARYALTPINPAGGYLRAWIVCGP